MRWYVTKSGETTGPVDESQITEWVRAGLRGCMVRDDAGGAWMPLDESPFAPTTSKPAAPKSISGERSKMIVDQVEKVGRFVLWISIAVVFALVPIGLYGREKQAAKDAEQARADHAREVADHAKEAIAEEEAKRPRLLTLASMGNAMRLLDGSTGYVWFSNAAPQDGILCLKGRATGNGQSTESLATCKQIGAFETNIKMSVMFAGASIKALCAGAPCQFTVEDVNPPDTPSHVPPAPHVAAKSPSP